jgi:hypothetical protein
MTTGLPSKAASCWSCMALNEQATSVCALCGADQTRPAAYVDPIAEAPGPVKNLWEPILVVVVGILCLGGIIFHTFSIPEPSLAVRHAQIAAKSLRDIREILSASALRGGQYPEKLESQDDRTGPPTQAALGAGYRLQYRHRAGGAGTAEGFVIVAISQESTELNLYIDESGIVHSVSERSDSKASDASF